MKLDQLKEKVLALEPLIKEEGIVLLSTFERDDRQIHVFLTRRFLKQARKERVWGSKAMLTALKNTGYGFDPTRVRSKGGTDGIFLIDRTHKPKNEMMRKLFDKFLDKPDTEALEISEYFGVELGEFLPVRVVSHDLRLLGLLHRTVKGDILVLVDCDRGT